MAKGNWVLAVHYENKSSLVFPTNWLQLLMNQIEAMERGYFLKTNNPFIIGEQFIYVCFHNEGREERSGTPN